MVKFHGTPSSKCSGRTVVCSAHCRPTVKEKSVPTVRAVHTLFTHCRRQCALCLHCGKYGLEPLRLAVGTVSSLFWLCHFGLYTVATPKMGGSDPGVKAGINSESEPELESELMPGVGVEAGVKASGASPWLRIWIRGKICLWIWFRFGFEQSYWIWIWFGFVRMVNYTPLNWLRMEGSKSGQRRSGLILLESWNSLIY